MSTRRAPCPVCNKGPRDQALSITRDERGEVAHCFRCGYVSANHTTTSPGIAPAPRTYRPWQNLASHLWDKAQPLRGSLAEKYLLSRSCRMPPDDADLRFLPASGEHPAAMVARITDAMTGEAISLHFTQLAADGTKLGRRLLAGHRKAGGVIRLWADDAVTQGLAIGEGIETCLSIAWVHTPVWSAVDAGNLASFPVLGGIEALTIFADHDTAGLKAARECGRRWRDGGRDARIRAASVGDVNDALRSAP